MNGLIDIRYRKSALLAGSFTSILPVVVVTSGIGCIAVDVSPHAHFDQAVVDYIVIVTKLVYILIENSLVCVPTHP